ncbi:MAG: type II and III secretion system protein [Bdellovibrionaceae bacterium]|nr:type II and III secretion system protein [Pseudobdellovibrionaceae bacterium]NUM59069.1 pilus assembly protein [Pseudobdellovibrionaceae bacterium]
MAISRRISFSLKFFLVVIFSLVATTKQKQFLISLSLLPNALAQEDSSQPGDDAPDSSEEHLAADTTDDSVFSTEGTEQFISYKQAEYINLTYGIEEDKKLPPLPKKIKIDGSYKGFVKLEYNKKMNIFRFKPLREGFGTLVIYDAKNKKKVAEYRINVRKNNLDKVVIELKGMLAEIDGINIKIINNKVVIDGQVLTPKDLMRIKSVLRQFGDKVDSIVTVNPMAYKKICEFIMRDINNPEIECRAANEKIILQGQVGSEDEKVKAEIIAKVYVPPVFVDPSCADGTIKCPKPANDGIINMLAIKEGAPPPPKKIVKLNIHYVELKKDYSKSFRFEWAPKISDSTNTSVSTGDSGGGIVTSLTAVISNLLPKLNSAKTHGHARVLESTSFMVKDGEKGSISQTIDEPYTVIGKDNLQGTAFTPTGLTAVITPTIIQDKSGSVEMKMEFQVSQKIGVVGNQPVVSKNALQTVITVRDRQSAAVGGLIKNSTDTNYNRDPASNTLFNALAAKGNSRNQNQFVVFVTPVIMTSTSTDSEKIKSKFKLPY